MRIPGKYQYPDIISESSSNYIMRISKVGRIPCNAINCHEKPNRIGRSPEFTLKIPHFAAAGLSRRRRQHSKAGASSTAPLTSRSNHVRCARVPSSKPGSADLCSVPATKKPVLAAPSTTSQQMPGSTTASKSPRASSPTNRSSF